MRGNVAGIFILVFGLLVNSCLSNMTNGVNAQAQLYELRQIHHEVYDLNQGICHEEEHEESGD